MYDRASDGYSCGITRRLGKQLDAKGLVFATGYFYERVEWQRVVSRLPIYALTTAGMEVAAHVTAAVAA